MHIEDCYFLGTITKAHGYKGELNVQLDTDDPQAYQNLESVFIEKNGLLVPFFLKSARLHRTNHLRIFIEDFDDPESLIGRALYLPLSTLPPLQGNKFYYHEVVGFLVLTKEGEEVGIITHVRDSQVQDLFEIKAKDGREILIPVIDDWIVEVNRKEKSIKVNLPDGLLEVF
ncbi:MAG: ribosome maturation factor RimM [Flavobacteriaceae bacterium]|nr:ribosome maturation factor RimM [Flavobacteriaceae bacterium]